MSEFYIKFRSKYIAGTTDVTIITPNPLTGEDVNDFYGTDRKFPVLWMLHGGYGCFADWVTYNKVPRYAAERNCIMVAPYAPNFDFANHPGVGEGFMFEDFFIKELVPFVRNWFHGSDDPEKNLISGNSMGCAASWRYGLTYPEIFGYVGPLCNQPLNYNYLEPYRNMTNKDFRELAGKEKIPTAYGIDSGFLHAKELTTICRYPTVGDFLDSIENTWARFDEAAASGKLPKIFLSGAIEKKWGPMMGMFKEHCDKLNIENITFDMYDQETHNSPFWEESVERFMEYAGLHKAENTLV